MASQRRSGTIEVQMNGEVLEAKGGWTYNPGLFKREAIVGSRAISGFKETKLVPFIEGEITDRGALDLAKLYGADDVTVTLTLANGKVFVLRNAWWAGDGDVGTEDANIACRFEGLSGEEVS